MKKEIRKIIESAIEKLQSEKIWPDFDMPEIVVESPKEEKFGDYTSNIAMVLSKILKKNPMEVAESIKNKVESIKPAEIEKIEIVKPGYINFYLSEKYFHDLIQKINSEEKDFGNSDLGKKQKVLLEFISCNPTGPIHLGNARGGPIGDVLANVLEKNGYDVMREFYVNDFGNQVEVLGHSVLKDAEAQYRGGYIDDLVGKKDEKMTDPMTVGVWAAGMILEELIKPTCEKSGIKFDNWFSEKSLHEEGKIEEVLTLLGEKKLTYEKEDALWYKSTEFGDDKDRVLVKSNKKKTYLTSDFAYHKNKIERGFERIIDIMGADHFKETEVVKAFVEKVLGYEGQINYILSQMVRVVKNGEEVKMSKRKGVYFALDDLIDEVGADAVRFIFASYAPSSHINFDMDLAKERSEKNPVFYVQYAYARIASIKNKAESITQKEDPDFSLLKHEKELSLLKELDKFPELVEELAGSYEVHKLPQYAIKLADKFHSFYNACRVIDEENSELTSARLELVKAVKIVLGETLRLIGVSAPEKM